MTVVAGWLRPASPASEPSPTRTRAPVKVAVVGRPGVGKTTVVASASQIAPVTTEVPIRTSHHATTVPAPTTSTAALDYGRTMLPDGMRLHLFGVPGQPRYRFGWDAVCRGAAAAIVLVDVRRLHGSFGPIDYVERAGLPFIVMVNLLHGASRHPDPMLRDALALTRPCRSWPATPATTPPPDKPWPFSWTACCRGGDPPVPAGLRRLRPRP